MSYNHTVLMGRITNNLELKQTPNGVSVLSFSIAVDRKYQADKSNKVTDFFDVVAWRNTAEFISKYFSKGSLILVDGELQTRTYEDKNGVKHKVVELCANEVNFTGEKRNDNQQFATASPYTAKPNEVSFEELGADDDLPF